MTNWFIFTALISSFSSADHDYEIDETAYEGKSYYTQTMFIVFNLNYLVTNTLHENSGALYTSLGCWKDSKPDRAMDQKMGEKLGLEGCYKEAKSKNFTVFGYQYGVQCYSSATIDAYTKYGKGTNCSPRGTGGPSQNQVYKIGTIVFRVVFYWI